MRVCVLFTPAPADASPEDLDGLVQRDQVMAALQELGHQVEALGFGSDLAENLYALREASPDCVFNLVEAVAGRDRLQLAAPALLEDLYIPFTGSGLEAMALCADKCAAKRRLRAAGMPTPDWAEASRPFPEELAQETVIIKARSSHASVGLDEHSLLRFQDGQQLKHRLQEMGPGWYVERFIDGREFNIALLRNGPGTQMLPPAEIDFSDFPVGKPRLVGYRAKWVAESFEYHHTNHIFDFPASDGPLLDEIRRLALAAWELFGLDGYARVDFRVDRNNRPWILEINTNPCLAQDAGFAAAAARAGLDYRTCISRILEAAVGC